MMEITEVPPVIEDFERGDRVYWVHNRTIQYGTVNNVYYQAEGSSVIGNMLVQFDNGEWGNYRGDEIATMKDRKQEFGKCLDVSRLEEGSVISRIQEGKRVYADVLSYTPKVKLAYRLRGQQYITIIRENDYNPTIEQQMCEWELEG